MSNPKLNILDGLLLVNKPKGITSHDVVAQVRRKLGMRDVGHTGTLDPMAEGLMVIALGEGTKLTSYIQDHEKSYELEFCLGISTDTLDSTGQILITKPVTQLPQEVISMAHKQIGEFNWPIPLFSAKKVEGRKLYELAREGVRPFQQPTKLMKFWQTEIKHLEGPRYVGRVHCSKGSFIRTWVEQLGESLGCGACMTSLRRLSTGGYLLEDAVEIQDLHDDLENLSKIKAFIPIQKSLMKVLSIKIQGQDAYLLKNGQISHDLRRLLIHRFRPEKDEIAQIFKGDDGRLLGIIGIEQNQGFKIRRIFK